MTPKPLRFAHLALVGAVALGVGGWTATLSAQETTFTFGGYVKFDAIASDFDNGTVDNTSVLRDIHFPGAIPVGGSNETFGTLDYHAKESRFNLGTRTTLENGKTTAEAHGSVPANTSPAQPRPPRMNATVVLRVSMEPTTPRVADTSWPSRFTWEGSAKK